MPIYIKYGEIKAYFHSRVLEIRQDSVRLATPAGEIDIRNDFVFAMTGYSPDFDFLHSVGIALDASPAR